MIKFPVTDSVFTTVLVMLPIVLRWIGYAVTVGAATLTVCEAVAFVRSVL